LLDLEKQIVTLAGYKEGLIQCLIAIEFDGGIVVRIDQMVEKHIDGLRILCHEHRGSQELRTAVAGYADQELANILSNLETHLDRLHAPKGINATNAAFVELVDAKLARFPGKSQGEAINMVLSDLHFKGKDRTAIEEGVNEKFSIKTVAESTDSYKKTKKSLAKTGGVRNRSFPLPD
jgi:hypothetical protein